MNEKNQMQQQARINILKDTKPVKCSCGSEFYQEVVSLREISAILSPTGKNEKLTIPVLICLDCKKRVESDSPVLMPN